MPGPADHFDAESTTDLGRRARRRVGYSHDRGEVIRFVVQLEYQVDDEWEIVVRYDHDAAGAFSHDVTEEGLHVDVHRDGRKYATESISGPLPGAVAFDLAEAHLAENAQRFIRRFEGWHP